MHKKQDENEKLNLNNYLNPQWNLNKPITGIDQNTISVKSKEL